MTAFVWSIDDAGSGGDDMVDAVRRTCRHLESRGTRGSWFVVPKSGGNPMPTEWRDALREARDAGHDIQLHGLTHEDCFEFGPPVWPAVDILPTMSCEFEQRREELMSRYTVENMLARIQEGQYVFRRELGVEPTVFRAPCGAISRPMFEALRLAGLRYHSCWYISGVGYEHLPHRSGDLRQKWSDTVPHQPFRWYSGVIEVPILSEYTWRGAWQREADFKALAQQDATRIALESPVAVLLMHTHGIADNPDYAFRLIDSVMDHVEAQGLGGFTTLGDLAASGKLEAVALPQGPDILSV